MCSIASLFALCFDQFGKLILELFDLELHGIAPCFANLVCKMRVDLPTLNRNFSSGCLHSLEILCRGGCAQLTHASLSLAFVMTTEQAARSNPIRFKRCLTIQLHKPIIHLNLIVCQEQFIFVVVPEEHKGILMLLIRRVMKRNTILRRHQEVCSPVLYGRLESELSFISMLNVIFVLCDEILYEVRVLEEV
jgi:hypothetical protein